MEQNSLELGCPEHLAQIVTNIWRPLSKIPVCAMRVPKGVRCLQYKTHKEILISVEELAKRAFPADFERIVGRISPNLRKRRSEDIIFVHDNMKKVERLIQRGGLMAALTNEKGFYIDHVVTDVEEALNYLPGMAGRTFGIVITASVDGARFVARQKRQVRIAAGLLNASGNDIKTVSDHDLLDAGRVLSLSLLPEVVSNATDLFVSAVFETAPSVPIALPQHKETARLAE